MLHSQGRVGWAVPSQIACPALQVPSQAMSSSSTTVLRNSHLPVRRLRLHSLRKRFDVVGLRTIRGLHVSGSAHQLEVQTCVSITSFHGVKTNEGSCTYSGSCFPNKLCESSRNSHTAPFRSHGLSGIASHLGTCPDEENCKQLKQIGNFENNESGCSYLVANVPSFAIHE